jgi:hypothetical protein
MTVKCESAGSDGVFGRWKPKKKKITSSNLLFIRKNWPLSREGGYNIKYYENYYLFCLLCVTDGGEGVCVDPGEKEAILEAGGPSQPGEGKGRQLASDSGGG